MKWGTGISVSFVEFVFVFVGSGVNGLMCLRTPRAGLNSLAGSDLQVTQTNALPGARRSNAHSGPLSCPDVPEYVMISWREKGQRWIEREKE